MKTARRAGLEGALVGEVLTIARGESWLTIPAREVPHLVAILGDLDLLSRVARAPAAAAGVAAPAAAAASAEPATQSWSPPAVSARRPKRARRGRVWEGVKTYLRQTERAQAFAPLLKMVKDQGLTERDPEHALRICLGKKVATGELIKTAAGRYAMPRATEEAVSTVEAPQSPAAPPRKKRKHRPGELWKQMKAHMADYPDGRTLDELVDAADEGRWTSAQSARHAVKICLSRVGDQVEKLEGGLFRLTGLMPSRGAPARPSAVRRRRKRDPGPAEAAPVLGAPEAAPAGAQPEHVDGSGKFDASAYYPTPRSRQPT